MKRIFIGPIQHTNYLVSSSTVEPTAVQGQSINKKPFLKKVTFFLSMASGITHKVGESKPRYREQNHSSQNT